MKICFSMRNKIRHFKLKRPRKLYFYHYGGCVYVVVLMAELKLKLNIDVPFSSEREAEIAYDVLRVDKEPPRSQISKSLSFDKNVLHICLAAPTYNHLRRGVNGFLDSLLLVCETMMSFGPPATAQYSHYN